MSNVISIKRTTTITTTTTRLPSPDAWEQLELDFDSVS